MVGTAARVLMENQKFEQRRQANSPVKRKGVIGMAELWRLHGEVFEWNLPPSAWWLFEFGAGRTWVVGPDKLGPAARYARFGNPK